MQGFPSQWDHPPSRPWCGHLNRFLARGRRRESRSTPRARRCSLRSASQPEAATSRRLLRASGRGQRGPSAHCRPRRPCRDLSRRRWRRRECPRCLQSYPNARGDGLRRRLALALPLGWFPRSVGNLPTWLSFRAGSRSDIRRAGLEAPSYAAAACCYYFSLLRRRALVAQGLPGAAPRCCRGSVGGFRLRKGLRFFFLGWGYCIDCNLIHSDVVESSNEITFINDIIKGRREIEVTKSLSQNLIDFLVHNP